MEYTWSYKTPEGFTDIVMRGTDEALTGLWFRGSRDDRRKGRQAEWRETGAFRETCRWLDDYFAGRDPGFTPRYAVEGLTQFRQDVIDELLKVPFGATVTYGEIAKNISKRRGGRKVSARAVGGAVGWNPISLVIPCHRVVGADGGLTGYGGGLGNKVSLLAHEGADLFDARLSTPKEARQEVDERQLRLCLQIVNKAAARHGLFRARCERVGGAASICLDDLVQCGVDATFIFDALGDRDAKTLLESFIDFRSLYQFDLALQLARLLADRGSLVRSRMGRLVAQTDWSMRGGDALLLAYLGSVKGGEAQLCRLIDVVPEDSRDGLFIACMKSSSARVQKRLLEAFERWIARDGDYGNGTGEAGWAGLFLGRWTFEGTFDYERLRTLTQWHLSRLAPRW